MVGPKIALGTVQFGLNYGIKNTRGQIPRDEIVDILHLAYENSINCLDTATAYGTSEQILGQILAEESMPFRIISKFPNVSGITLEDSFNQTLSDLKVSNLYGYILHSYETYEKKPGRYDELLALKESGKVEKIGMSLYNPIEYETLVHPKVPIDILQFPLNILDQPFLPLLPDMRNRGIEIHVRSVFLQGLLLMDPTIMSKYFISVAEKMILVRKYCEQNNISIVALLLGFAQRQKHIQNVVLGVDCLDDLRSNIVHWEEARTKTLDDFDYDLFASRDLNILLPMNWKV